jgi:hypothetical protein
VGISDLDMLVCLAGMPFASARLQHLLSTTHLISHPVDSGRRPSDLKLLPCVLYGLSGLGIRHTAYGVGVLDTTFSIIFYLFSAHSRDLPVSLIRHSILPCRFSHFSVGVLTTVLWQSFFCVSTLFACHILLDVYINDIGLIDRNEGFIILLPVSWFGRVLCPLPYFKLGLCSCRSLKNAGSFGWSETWMTQCELDSSQIGIDVSWAFFLGL